MAGPIYHERHIWHKKSASTQDNLSNTATFGKYIVKVLLFVEQRWIDNKKFYHQDQDGWLDWCETNRQKLQGVFYTI